ncbi:DUF1702 family protein [Tengunoibacter tsumagoiensis]|uniref:Enediyne biosynthesis protein n=1 Tax=Tengunoibacter tsumagoiensis TaxID=2014871 RepID=A0A402AA53_9CHLR|nr:DUF1702 family protein [Tengunoibacter tsumagoiensis]GCE15781.1 enediyne biosynthesis protein [Tengunoibacter tsumagoiensis]
MPLLSKSLPRLCFGISAQEADFSRRGFIKGDLQAKEQLEKSARTFIEGYNAALDNASFAVLVPRLQMIPEDLRGFAFEGAAMGLMVLDYFTPWKHRLRSFVEGPGAAHMYMLYVGAGWTLGILPQPSSRFLKQMDPLLGWLALDGYGFHQGFFAWKRSFQQQKRPLRLRGYAQRAFDHGLGRSLWFVKGADIARIAQTIQAFPLDRQPDLWSGIGLACAYAGGIDEHALSAVIQQSGPWYPHLAQGTVFAVTARYKAGNVLDYTRLACQRICHADVQEMVDLADNSLKDLPHDETAYETWRTRIRSQFSIMDKATQATMFSEKIV